MPTSPIEVLLQRDMEWRGDDVTKFAADISSRVRDADTLVGAPSIKAVEYVLLQWGTRCWVGHVNKFAVQGKVGCQ